MNKVFIVVIALLMLIVPNARARQDQFYVDRTASGWLVDQLSLGGMIGSNRSIVVREEDDLISVARNEGVGYQEILDANPGVDEWLPPDKEKIVLPEHRLLPEGIEPGVTINLAEFMLYIVEPSEGRDFTVYSYPVGIGQEDFATPMGSMVVSKKIKNPVWAVPPSVRREHPEYPRSFPPGPDNALGDYWIGLSQKGYGLHGTNKPLGIGRRVSHGCIRLYPEDVEDLFSKVTVGTKVNIIYQPVKVAVRHGALLVEYHEDYMGSVADPVIEIIQQATRLGWSGNIDWPQLLSQLEQQTGIPVIVSR